MSAQLNMHGHLAFGESGERILAEDFNYDLCEAVDEAAQNLEQFTPEDFERAGAAFETLMRWVWQSGMKNPDGVKIRAIIACWIFLKALRPMNLTQLAQHYGMDKQSFGRWVDDFKLRFPNIRTVHMRNFTLDQDHEAHPKSKRRRTR